MNLFVDTSVWSLALRRDHPSSQPVVDRLRIALESGKYPGMKIEQARNEAKRLLSLIAGKTDPVEADRFLNPDLSHLAPPRAFRDADIAIDRLLRAVRQRHLRDLSKTC